MKKLLKSYQFRSIIQYYEMIADSFTNGQRTQAVEQFKAMPRKERIELLKAATLSDYRGIFSDNDLRILFDNL